MAQIQWPQTSVTSWGRVTNPLHTVSRPTDRHAALPINTSCTWLPRGNGRSYGDSNLNPGQGLIDGTGLDRFITFDPATGELCCEAGVLLRDVLRLCVPQGWFLPSTPGTQFVTIGGAIANDVHGKNHHQLGTFGHHVSALELLRSDGTRFNCSPTENAALFAATVGGLGLTGFITQATLQLRRVRNPWMVVETIRFRSLDEFFVLAASSDRSFEYTVSWIDCAGTGRNMGRGLFNRANHAPMDAIAPHPKLTKSKTVPFTPPISLVNRASLLAFNQLYFHAQRGDVRRSVEHYAPFFYPLDKLLQWNRIYGPRGFYQYQSVVPPETAHEATAAMLSTISKSGQGSFLAVLKQFGHQASRGLLSFPRPGTTLALDFPNRGLDLARLLASLDDIVLQAGGALYPAKDGRMGARMFKASYPQWPHFLPHMDPNLSSGFWRRIQEDQ